MASLNKVMLIGNLGKDPEIRSMGNGGKVASFSIATSETWKDKQSGEKREKTEWHNIVIFNEHLVKVAENYLKKGSKVYIEGALQTRKWQDREGNDKYTAEIVLQRFKGELTMLDSKPSGNNRNGDYQTNQDQGRQDQSGNDFDKTDSIPF